MKRMKLIFFFPLCVRVYVFVELTRWPTQKYDESFLHKHKHTSAASELILNRITNAGKFVTVLNFNSKGLDSAWKQVSLEAERALLLPGRSTASPKSSDNLHG